MDQSDWRGGGQIRRRRTVQAPRGSQRPALRKLLLETLEPRHVLSGVSLQAISGPDTDGVFDIPSGKDLYVPLIGADSGQTVTYSAASSNPDVSVQVLPSSNPVIEMTVTGTDADGTPFQGTMTFELFADIAPETVAGIVSLVDQGVYNGAEFYRSETSSTFQLIQGGIEPPTGVISGKSQEPVLPDEFNAAASFNSSGLLAMANAGPNTASSEFFVMGLDRPLADDPQELNFGYTIFGQLLTGANIYNDILNVPTLDENGINYDAVPVTIGNVAGDHEHQPGRGAASLGAKHLHRHLGHHGDGHRQRPDDEPAELRRQRRAPDRLIGHRRFDDSRASRQSDDRRRPVGQLPGVGDRCAGWHSRLQRRRRQHLYRRIRRT